MVEISDAEEAQSLRNSLEVKSIDNIRPKDIEDLDALVEKETSLYISAPAGALKEELGTAAFVHAQAVATLRDAIRDKKSFSLIFLRGTNGEVVGYSLVGLDLTNPAPFEKVKYDFIGVRSDRRRQGVGMKLLETRLDILRQMGIIGYKSNSRGEVIRLYDKLGINYSLEQLPRGHSAPGTKRVIVKL